MDAGKQNLLNFLGQNQQLSIPIYQRKYSWTDKECNQLFEDVLRVGASTKEENHFIGSIVYMNQKGHIASPINKLLIIDGQQRITTISLLVSALSDFLFKNPNENIMNPYNLINYYLINDKETGELKYKLILTDDDKVTLIKIIDNLTVEDKIPFDDDDSIRVKENYEYFKKRINEVNAELIYQGLSKLLIIFVALEHNIDNPQLIFESLNSTGLELSQADLIRNYILMGLEPEEQEKLYTTYWQKIEKTFEESVSWYFDKFIRDYLTVRTDRVPTFRNIYRDFKKYSKEYDKVDELVKDVFKFSRYFSCIAFGKEQDPKLKEALDSLSSMGYDVTYPFLLHLYKDYDLGLLSVDEFIEIIRYTESYLLRRLICSIPTPSLNKTFAKMYNDIDTDNYSESYQVQLVLKENYQRMPRNREFGRNFRERDIYNLRGKNKEYIFDKFENWNSKERTPVESYTIEHIMPQNPNLSQEWRDCLGPNWEEIQKTYLHTIGNLTLTGYNAELSDRPFQEKRDMEGGFRQSAIRLNVYLQDLPTWNENEIKKRANHLIEEAYKIWKYPEVSQEVIDKYTSNDEEPLEIDVSGFTEVERLRFDYWTEFNSYLKENDDLFVYPMPSNDTWYSLFMNTGIAHIELTISAVLKNTINVHFRIKKDSNEIFDKLYAQKDIIESEVGMELEWDKAENHKISKIGKTLDIDINDKYNWERAIEWQYDMSVRLRESILPKVQNLK